MHPKYALRKILQDYLEIVGGFPFPKSFFIQKNNSEITVKFLKKIKQFKKSPKILFLNEGFPKGREGCPTFGKNSQIIRNFLSEGVPMNTVLSVGVFLVGPLRSLSLSFTALPIEMFFLTNVEFIDVGRRAGGRPLSLGCPQPHMSRMPALWVLLVYLTCSTKFEFMYREEQEMLCSSPTCA